MLRYLLIAAVLLPGVGAEATEWRLAPADLLSNFSMAEIRRRYPDIMDATALESLLIEISRKKPLLSLEATLEDGIIVIRGVAARPISEINFKLTTRRFLNELESRAYKYFGQVNSPEIRAKLKLMTQSYLRRRGFYRAKVSLKTTSKGDKESLEIKVDEDYPCLIREIRTDFRFPRDAVPDVNVGDICDRDEIEDALEGFEEDLDDLGYNLRRILKPVLNYDPKSNSAELLLPGSLGQKVSYRINSPVTGFFDPDLSEIDPSIVDPDSMRTEISNKYRDAGYDDVVVPAPITDRPSPGQVIYVFNVQPGIRYHISNVEIQGATAWSHDEILEIMDLEGLLFSPLSRNAIREGIERLQGEYLAHGYWDTKIHLPRITKDRNTGQSKIVLVIEEGKQRLFEKLIIRGNHSVPTEEIASLFDGERGGPLVWGDLLTFEQSLRELYAKAGYIYASFKIDLIHNNSWRAIETRILLTIDEEKRVKFGDIHIAGLVNTRDYVVRREVRFESGEWYSPEKVEKTKESLIKLGLFSSVNIIPSDSSALAEKLSTIAYTIVVREGTPGSASFGPGWSFYKGLRYAAEASYNNIYGTGRQIFVKGSISEEKHQKVFTNKTMLGNSIGMTYVEPWVLELPVNGNLSLSHKAQVISENNWEISRAGELSGIHELRHMIDNATFTGFYGQKITRVESLESSRDGLIDTENVRSGRIGWKLEVDHRDDISWPTEGFILVTKMALANYPLGGDLRYFRWDVQTGNYFELYDDLVLALGTSFSSFDFIERRGDTRDVLPTSERLNAGGSDSNRGFKPDDLGPIFYRYNADTGEYENDSNGGSSRNIFKLELRYQIIDETMAITSFLDASNVFFSPDQTAEFNEGFAANSPDPDTRNSLHDNSWYPFETLLTNPEYLWRRNYISYGLALNYLTPLGSFNLSYGIPWKNCPVDGECFKKRGITDKPTIQSGQFHINVGATF